MNNNLKIFCRQIRARSNENKKAVELLAVNEIYSQVVSILRQELDSMIRAIYLLKISDKKDRNDLIKRSIEGKKWEITDEEGKKKKIRDSDMCQIASQLHGWTENVYKFGCSFIHLSNLHDYQSIDPFSNISKEDKKSICEYINSYHFARLDEESTFEDLKPYLSKIFEKIQSNLECYIKDLEQEKIIK